jgi:hypothetical protein
VHTFIQETFHPVARQSVPETKDHVLESVPPPWDCLSDRRKPVAVPRLRRQNTESLTPLPPLGGRTPVERPWLCGIS